MPKIRFLIIGIAALVIAWAIWWPPTRAILFWLLPLGSGIDDFFQAAVIIVGGVFLAFGLLAKRRQ